MFRTTIAAFALLAASATAGAQGLGVKQGLLGAPGPDEPLQLAADNCYAVGQQVAARRGAQLASAQAVKQDGQTVCRIVLLIPGQDGQRPRREEVVVSG